MKRILTIALLCLPLLAWGQTSPTNTAGFTISTQRPMTTAQYLAILGDSLEAMEARVVAALADSARAAADAALADSLPVVEARLQQFLADSLVVIEGRLYVALGDTARAVVNAALADSLPVMESRLQQMLADSLVVIEGRLAAALSDSVAVAVTEVMADSLPVIEARLMDWLQASVDTTAIGELTLRVDSLQFYYGEAGDTTSPGKFYYLNPGDSLWYRADTSVTVAALGVAADSINKGAICRFQHTGFFRDADYDNIIIPGLKVVNDSVTAGLVAVTDSLRTSTKKMQRYGVALDSITIMLNIGPAYSWED